MSLTSALNIGRNALAVQQAAIQVTSNNIANAGNADYTRQTAYLVAGTDYRYQPGIFLGTGVNLQSVNRQIDNALTGRLRAAVSDNTSADTTQTWLARVESVFNALGTNGLSAQMSTFFNAFSKLAGTPQDLGQRQIVVTNGTALAKNITDVRKQLTSLRTDLDERITAQATSLDDYASQVADLNKRITLAESGSNGLANSLRDQRDAIVKKMSELANVSTVEDGGSLNLFIGSQPLVQGTISRGITVKQTSDSSGVRTELVFKDDQTPASVTGGEIGGLLDARTVAVDTTKSLDTLASGLIFELNKLHSSGQGIQGLTKVASSNSVSNINARLDSAGLPFPVQNGSFVVTVTDKNTGLSTSKLIKVDLGSGTATPTTLSSLASQITDSQISASVAGGKLTISANSPDVTFSFSQDSSNVLAAMGVNTFFTGTNASNIGVNSLVSDNPQFLAAAQNGSTGDNGTALAIAAIDTKGLDSLDGLTLRQSYDTLVSGISASVSASKTVAEGTAVVLQTLEAQRESLSGVSLDEESINLIKQQRAFQGAARIISTVDELMQTVLDLVR